MDPNQSHSFQHQSTYPHVQQLDSTPQETLAEARKQLQGLIESGISRDLLHQWVDDGHSLQLSFLNQSSFVNQPSSPSHPQASSFIPPPPQCPPPPPPMAARTPSDLSVPSAASSSTSTTSPTPSGVSSTTTPTGSAADIKTEPMGDANVTWGSLPASQALHNGPLMPHNNETNSSTGANIFLPPSFSNAHRARISVSSTSSGSSGHASLWSVNSGRSSMSWHSASTARTQAPLPMPPISGSMSSLPVINGSQVPSGVPSGNKHNIYWCTSCDTSFKRKYDWKRHEDEFHERWRKYPCPEPGCNRSFWGSNSFNQHHKQCHNCTTCPHAEKVVKFLRKRKFWACGFCSALHPARERHVEHVARHFESGLTKNDWMHSRVIYGLIHQPLIHSAWDALVASKNSDFNGSRPQFSWHPSKTGRAQGFLEKENPGQLQDLLEFFSGDEAEAQWVVSIAYELADVVMTNAPALSTPYPQQQEMAPPSSYPQDVSTNFNQLPTPQQSHAPPQPPMHLSSTPVQQTPFASPHFQGPIYTAPQQFNSSQTRPSPESSSNSPLTLSSPQMMLSSLSQEKQDLPALPSQSHGMMDFEYSPAPMYGDWGSLTEHLTPNTTPQSQQQQQQSNAGDWGEYVVVLQ